MEFQPWKQKERDSLELHELIMKNHAIARSLSLTPSLPEQTQSVLDLILMLQGTMTSGNTPTDQSPLTNKCVLNTQSNNIHTHTHTRHWVSMFYGDFAHRQSFFVCLFYCTHCILYPLTPNTTLTENLLNIYSLVWFMRCFPSWGPKNFPKRSKISCIAIHLGTFFWPHNIGFI